jgi:predicted GNAT family acetyltransferase
MDYIRVTSENIEREHVCCAISSNKDCQVMAKKSWLSDRFADGLVFLRGNVRGKFFIEYLPAEKAWSPIDAEGHMYIDCFWIAGQYKGHGYANELLDECIRDSKEKGKKGLCVLSSQKKKMPFLSDPGYLAHKGFQVADTAAPFFALLYLPFEQDAPVPKFRACVKQPPAADGFLLYYADQCPYTAKYVPLVADAAKENGIPLKAVHIETTREAQSAPTPFTSFTLFYNGRFITNEILSVQKFLKIAGGSK